MMLEIVMGTRHKMGMIVNKEIIIFEVGVTCTILEARLPQAAISAIKWENLPQIALIYLLHQMENHQFSKELVRPLINNSFA